MQIFRVGAYDRKQFTYCTHMKLMLLEDGRHIWRHSQVASEQYSEFLGIVMQELNMPSKIEHSLSATHADSEHPYILSYIESLNNIDMVIII